MDRNDIRELELRLREEADKILDALITERKTFGSVEYEIETMKRNAEGMGYAAAAVFDLALKQLNNKMKATLIQSGTKNYNEVTLDQILNFVSSTQDDSKNG